jgi:hypothetical protein
MKVMCLIVHIEEIAARSFFFSFLSLSIYSLMPIGSGGAIRYKIISSVICFSLDYDEREREEKK